MRQTLYLVLLLVIAINAQDDISDKVNIKVAGQDALDSLMIDSIDEEENVTEMEMEDVTMTTPITTPRLETIPDTKDESQNDESLETNVEDDDAELGKSLEINTDISDIAKENEVENEVEEKSFGNKNGWFYFSSSDPKLVTLYQTVQQYPSNSPSATPVSKPYKAFVPIPWSLPQQWASKPQDTNTQKINSYFPHYPLVYYSYQNKV